MSKEEIIGRILSDAQAEADEIAAAAGERVKALWDETDARISALKEETEEEISARAKRISEGKAAAARLDSAKILLAEKRRVLDEIYARALKALLSMSEHDSLVFLGKLFSRYAEEGETVVFAEDFPYAAKAAGLPVVAQKHLVIAKERAPIAGGFLLKGEDCDKDVSFSALLAADREEHQAELAVKIFK